MIEVLHHSNVLSQLPETYQALNKGLLDSSFDNTAAQAHGVACGLVCRGVKTGDLDAIIVDFSFDDSYAISALEGLMEMASQDLNQIDFSFDLYLPDDAELEQLSDALADWCQGYIIGLMHDGETYQSKLNPELQESLQDIIKIAGLQSTTSGSTEDEIAFIELREYLRTVTQLIFEELVPVDD